MDKTLAPGALQPGINCWRMETATQVSVIVDADAYFSACRAAMLMAKRRIMLIGWDFDARIKLGHGDNDAPEQVGDLLLWLVNRRPDLEIFVLRWDVGALKSLMQPTTMLKLVQWMLHPRVEVRLDSAHPFAASHHQKIVVIDDCLAFCGGIDMTEGRWDTPQHLDDDPGRVGPSGVASPPWHDATTAIAGPAAAALGELCRTRWERAGGKALAPIADVTDCWPQWLEADFNNVTVAIARTAPEMPEWECAFEIEQLYLDMIGRAQRSIYAESQYFASRRVAEAMARRLQEKAGPDIIVINPISAQGWLEPLAMDSARARLYQALHRCDRYGRLRMYHPLTKRGADIYVHAKIMIVDEQLLRVGSSNLNNRSMRLDTECDVVIDATLPQNAEAGERIAAIRTFLMAEHLGVAPQVVEAALQRHGRLSAAIDTLLQGNDRMRAYQVPDMTSVEEWLAHNEILDPESPDEMFEPLANDGLLRNFRL